MRRRVSHCLLLALLAVFSAAPAAANPIVGSFYFQTGVCDFVAEPECDPAFQFEYFVLDNAAYGALAGLTFSAVLQVGGTDYVDQFFHSLQLASGESVLTSGLPSTSPFIGGGTASLVFTGNFALFGGTLGLSNLLYDDADPTGDYLPSFTAAVEFIEDAPVAVTESSSWLVVVIGLGALAVGRALFI